LLELAFDENSSNAWRSSCGARHAPRRKSGGSWPQCCLRRCPVRYPQKAHDGRRRRRTFVLAPPALRDLLPATRFDRV